MNSGKVAIIGGGLGGLYTAYRLARMNVDWVLIEARDRLGGRILSTPGPGPRHDLGPAWLWPDFQPRIAALVEELGLDAFDQYTTGEMLVERSLQESPRRVLGFVSGNTSVRIDGGIEQLIQALARQLPAERIVLDSRISSLRSTPSGIALQTFEARPTLSEARFSQVISALPLRLLARDIMFEPLVEAQVRQGWMRTPTWMAPHAKYVALYDQPFWRDEGLSGMARSHVGPLVEIHDASHARGDAALFGFIGIAATARRQLGEVDLLEACRRQMGRLFGARAAAPVAHYLKDWAGDGLTATEADLQGQTSHPRSHPVQPMQGHWAGRLLVAGSEAAREHPGYMEGALEAADSALRHVL
ncbi:flavin monoamine oxidase family protein [Pseudomonas gingeri]|uniref:flavin monoamine oxidase family protein n=1 Tax=Pseudomonas gingeri TaxID=117681 RepID=UPI00159FF659|nr:FAD-dependent oxidoreductase [Pseudomonas gingeri]NWA11038.1 FAD-dependent oxidoreductase [Pseudomonas gingeri]